MNGSNAFSNDRSDKWKLSAECKFFISLGVRPFGFKLVFQKIIYSNKTFSHYKMLTGLVFTLTKVRS